MQNSSATDSAGIRRVPHATYRLQFNSGFTLAHACDLVSYLHDLGISHVYASPLLKAVPGSMHGYDICDFHELNPEVGTPADFAGLHAALAQHQMGLILDVVPNHMGIEGSHNAWWWDVLTHGTASRYATCFDIDWQSPDPRLRGKVALPVLTERYNEALVQGAIRLGEREGKFRLEYRGSIFPVSPESVSEVLRSGAGSVREGGAPALEAMLAEVNSSPQALDNFIQKQNYLLMFWRNGNAVLNYRRFFTITSLAGLRIEEPRVFQQAFALVKQWMEQGWVSGLRVDHADGLRFPEQFLRRLREMAPKAWIVVEKILEPGEPLNPRWPVDGTTGYDFLNNLNGVFIEPQAEKAFTEFHRDFTGDALDYSALVRAKKRMVIHDQLTAETNRLTELFAQISARHWECRDFTRAELSEAWTELATCIPVYRTYAGAKADAEVSMGDARLIHAAAATARQHRPDLPATLFDFLEDLLLLRRSGSLEDDFALRFQQLTGPVMAKSVEDTAFYCYARFAALNEVGGDPARFGLTVAAFHELSARQQTLWPASMSATSTHDTKWGGDVRARLALLSERPREWMQAVRRWGALNESKRTQNKPDRKMEYLFYQALVGAWPLTRERALAYTRKAAREAKEQTNWQRPVPEYEEALEKFVGEAMEDSSFLAEVEQFVTPLLEPGWVNSLAQTLVKMTAPGVPDFYQGSELWDLSLADPDNRRQVDFALRKKLLAEAKGLSPEEAWRRRSDGTPKLWLIWKVLAARRQHSALFEAQGEYEPLKVTGAQAARVLAFMRGKGAVTVVPRLMGTGHDEWRETAVDLPPGRWRNVLTDALVESGRIAPWLARFPVAFLLREENS